MPYEDYHTHHERCGHAMGSLRHVIETAGKKGLDAIGLSDHAPLLFLEGDWPLPNTAMPRSAYEGYVREMRELQGEFAAHVRVKAGVEADYVETHVDAYRELLARHPLDYAIGSVHFIDGWSLFGRERPGGLSREDLWDRNLALLQGAAQCGLFDIIGHLDVLKTKGHLPKKWHTPRLEETLDAIADTGIAIELNTSGWRKPVGECFPSAGILELAAKRNIPVCLGSDAHRPQDVGAGFERAASLLRDAGYTTLASFAGRERMEMPLVH